MEYKNNINERQIDRIKSMNAEELHSLFIEIYNAGSDDAMAYENGIRRNSFEWTEDWLNSEVE